MDVFFEQSQGVPYPQMRVMKGELFIDTPVNQLLENFLVVHGVQIAVFSAHRWQVTTDGIIPRFGDNELVIL